MLTKGLTHIFFDGPKSSFGDHKFLAGILPKPTHGIELAIFCHEKQKVNTKTKRTTHGIDMEAFVMKNKKSILNKNAYA